MHLLIQGKVHTEIKNSILKNSILTLRQMRIPIQFQFQQNSSKDYQHHLEEYLSFSHYLIAGAWTTPLDYVLSCTALLIAVLSHTLHYV